MSLKQINNYAWGKIYRGTKQELIDLGIMQNGWFPGEHGNNTTSLRVWTKENKSHVVINKCSHQLARDENLIYVKKIGNKFEVITHYTIEIYEINKAKEKRLYNLAKALDDEKVQLSKLATSANEAKGRYLTFMQSMTGGLIGQMELGRDGYYFDDETIEKLKLICNEIHELLNEGKVSLNKKARDNLVLKIKLKKVGLDSGFSSFINNISKQTIKL